MTQHAGWPVPLMRPRPIPGMTAAMTVLTIIALVLASVAIAQGLMRYGTMAAVAGIALVPIAWAILAPRSCAWGILAALILVEPSAFDLTAPLSDAIYRFPVKFDHVLPLTVAPVELLSLVVLGSLLVRDNDGRGARWRRVPALAIAVPVMLIAGLAYGYVKQGDMAIAYHEMRGLLFAIVAFAIAIEVGHASKAATCRVLTWATAGAALVLLGRYFFFTRSGLSGVPLEFAYAHESVLFLGGGIALSAGRWLANDEGRARWPLVLHAALLLAAVLVTGRRAGTLVVLVMAVLMLAMYIRRRPLAGTMMGLLAVVCFGAYTAVYWNQEFGALAQPARAIRSQFDPSLRDESSDSYRQIERSSILVTLRSNPVFGVGFGNRFAASGELPNLRAFWPLQQYTTHQNVLWLWLKMGILGISTILGVWMIAAGRAVRSSWIAPKDGPFPLLPMVLMALLGAYLFFASVDITFSQTRSAAPLGAALALAFLKLPAWTATSPPAQEPAP